MTKDEMMAHLPMIQGVINRMGNNSFLIKGWTVTLLAAIFALEATANNNKFIFIGLISTAIFWFLDSYYLKQEKLYRELYNNIIINYTNINAFTMDVEIYKTRWIPSLMFTISTGPFYSFLFGVQVFIAIIIYEIISLDILKNLYSKYIHVYFCEKISAATLALAN